MAVSVMSMFAIQPAHAFLGFHLPGKKVVLAGAAVIGAKVAFDHLIKHPEKIGDWIGNHPEKIGILTAYTEQKIQHAKNDKEREKFITFKEKLALD